MKGGIHVLVSVINKKNFFNMNKSKHAQIWVETVLYTLIALVMIGLVLAFVKPKIMELQDQAIIDQSIAMMKDIDSTILTIGGPGNKRVIELGIKKGSLIIDGADDKVLFEIESSYTYSELGTWIDYGEGINIITEKRGEDNLVTIFKDYGGEKDITYNKQNILKTITKAPTPYKLSISNEGGDITNINFEVE